MRSGQPPAARGRVRGVPGTFGRVVELEPGHSLVAGERVLASSDGDQIAAHVLALEGTLVVRLEDTARAGRRLFVWRARR